MLRMIRNVRSSKSEEFSKEGETRKSFDEFSISREKNECSFEKEEGNSKNFERWMFILTQIHEFLSRISLKKWNWQFIFFKFVEIHWRDEKEFSYLSMKANSLDKLTLQIPLSLKKTLWRDEIWKLKTEKIEEDSSEEGKTSIHFFKIHRNSFVKERRQFCLSMKKEFLAILNFQKCLWKQNVLLISSKWIFGFISLQDNSSEEKNLNFQFHLFPGTSIANFTEEMKQIILFSSFKRIFKQLSSKWIVI